MRYPNFLPNPALMSDEARIFHPGAAVQVTCAPCRIGQGGDVFALPGPVPSDAWAVLDYAVTIVHRIVPWAVVYAAPIVVIESPPDGYPCREILKRKNSSKDYVKVGVLSFDAEDLIALSLSSSAAFLISSAYHEAWHQIEKILDKAILDEVNANLIPMSWGSAYLDSMIERRARSFENWCGYYEEGLPARRLATRIDEIFDAVAIGEVAKEWMRQQKRAAKDQSH